MKRKFSIVAGLCLMATASAIGRAEIADVITESANPQAAAYGQLALESLTDEQRQALQTKYKYWRSSGYSIAKAPL
ncbi:MAG: hypothetical protein AB7F79_08965 [Steroidobacteraceae bacterium]